MGAETGIHQPIAPRKTYERRVVRWRVVPHPSGNNILPQGAGVKAPLRRKKEFLSAPAPEPPPKIETAAEVWRDLGNGENNPRRCNNESSERRQKRRLGNRWREGRHLNCYPPNGCTVFDKGCGLASLSAGGTHEKEMSLMRSAVHFERLGQTLIAQNVPDEGLPRRVDYRPLSS